MNPRTRLSRTRILPTLLTALLLTLAAWPIAAQQPPAAAPQKPAVDTSKIKLGPSCITAECHGDMKKPEFLHGPVNLGQCAPCHIAEGDMHVFKPVDKNPDTTCLICHEKEKPMAVVHKPYASDCLLCHNPHGGDNRQFVTGGTGADGCLRCHDDPRKDLKFLHGPLAMGECLVCHTPHQSEYKGLLVDQEAALCKSCHVDVENERKGAVSVHPPAENNCAGCHHPHGGNIKYFLTAEKEALCQTCHADFLAKIKKYKNQHKPMTEGKACANCHAPHASNQEGLLAANNMELCLSCHDKSIQADDRTISNVAEQIKDSKYLHGPIREKNCIACHQAHGSDFPNILEKAFPADFYAPFTEQAYDLCFACHDRQIVEHAESTVTGFRNGNENLHYKHVNREKGRSCRACHAEHASNQPKHIRSSVPFGRWVMEVKYTMTPSGGGCTTGCHLPYKYDRDNPVKNETVEQ